ncbi:RNase H family protein [Paeniglutamicibacter gangotriensis]|uniref:Ribonuclease H n=2 Tax=Paeniglutamicibacter gangotriensis TaxID=254787 RepID=M7MQ22_9MICC|nr:ribonuclease HI family protein [Paeniglutamicibacter gangotriensis]EMQ98472.1 Ribonuclease H [Paeniglutamicibacter gangotriensis Lz1y]KAA0975160.1 ribonuclease HI family protein [Paeniglutamicibacter gangotriensis]
MTITAAADGSALGNPGPAGWAWYIDDARWRSGGWAHGTNNMGELMAVLDLFRSTAHLPDEDLHILCDSQYVINSVTKWMPGWKKKGWKKSDGKPVLNLDLFKEIDEAIKGRKYTFEWVKGHAGHELNEAADVRARDAATAYQAGRAPNAGPGLAGTSGTTDPTAADKTTEPADPAPAAEETSPAPDARPAAPVPESGAAKATDPSASSTADVQMVFELESELLSPTVRSDLTEVMAFLHPEFQEISRDGSLTDRSTIITAFNSGAPLHAGGALQVLAVTPWGRDKVQLAYRLLAGDQVILCSSFWQRVEDRWLLRYRQETPSS